MRGSQEVTTQVATKTDVAHATSVSFVATIILLSSAAIIDTLLIMFLVNFLAV